MCPPVPFASKSGGHVPQLLWERRPCLYRCIRTKTDTLWRSSSGDCRLIKPSSFHSTLLQVVFWDTIASWRHHEIAACKDNDAAQTAVCNVVSIYDTVCFTKFSTTIGGTLHQSSLQIMWLIVLNVSHSGTLLLKCVSCLTITNVLTIGLSYFLTHKTLIATQPTNAVVACEIKLFRNYFRAYYCSSWIFSHVFNVAAEICLAYNDEIIS